MAILPRPSPRPLAIHTASFEPDTRFGRSPAAHEPGAFMSALRERRLSVRTSSLRRSSFDTESSILEETDDDDSPPSSISDARRGNPADGPFTVLKLGGTSLGKFVETLADEIVPTALDQGHQIAIVCSARSSSTKGAGTTSLLLRAATEALAAGHANGIASLSATSSPSMSPVMRSPAPDTTYFGLSSGGIGDSYSESPSFGGSPIASPRSGFRFGPQPIAQSFSLVNGAAPTFHAVVDAIQEEHVAAARHLIRDPDILGVFEVSLDHDCQRLHGFLLAAQIIEELSPRSQDVIIGVGERLACRLVTALLRDRGFDAELVTLDNIVPTSHAVVEDGAPVPPLDSAFFDSLAERLGERLRACDGRIPVVSGYFGAVPGSILAQVGRGYSDLCAGLCAVGLGAAELQIWKEVDGVFTADPRKVPTARLLPHITPAEAAELTFFGSEVVHPQTMGVLQQARIPVRIKNIRNPAGEGTVIADASPSLSKSSSVDALAGLLDDFGPNVSTPRARQEAGQDRPTRLAVTVKGEVSLINVRSNRQIIGRSFFARAFALLDTHGLAVDLVATSHVCLSIAVPSSRPAAIERLVRDLESYGTVTLRHDMSILSLVGTDTGDGLVKHAQRMFGLIADAGIGIASISQGSSEFNLSCAIASADADRALVLVHDGVVLGQM